MAMCKIIEESELDPKNPGRISNHLSAWDKVKDVRREHITLPLLSLFGKGMTTETITEQAMEGVRFVNNSGSLELGRLIPIPGNSEYARKYNELLFNFKTWNHAYQLNVDQAQLPQEKILDKWKEKLLVEQLLEL